MNKCDKCGFLHYRTDPCRKPTNKSLPHAAGSETNAKGGAVVIGPDSQRGEAGATPAKLKLAAGKSTAARKDVREGGQLDARPGARSQYPTRGSNPTQAGSAGTQALPVDTNSEAGWAPATKFDRKAWMREYQRNYMRNVYRPKLKASKSQGETK